VPENMFLDQDWCQQNLKWCQKASTVLKGMVKGAKMQQQRARMKPKATKRVPKWNPNRQKCARMESKTAQGSSKGTLAKKS
jgi:hypothetical protein